MGQEDPWEWESPENGTIARGGETSGGKGDIGNALLVVFLEKLLIQLSQQERNTHTCPTTAHGLNYRASTCLNHTLFLNKNDSKTSYISSMSTVQYLNLSFSLSIYQRYSLLFLWSKNENASRPSTLISFWGELCLCVSSISSLVVSGVSIALVNWEKLQ